jgi:hypothetical protein
MTNSNAKTSGLFLPEDHGGRISDTEAINSLIPIARSVKTNKQGYVLNCGATPIECCGDEVEYSIQSPEAIDKSHIGY